MGHNTTDYIISTEATSQTNPHCVDNCEPESSGENHHFSTEFLQSMPGNHCIQDQTMDQGYNMNDGFEAVGMKTVIETDLETEMEFGGR